MKNWACKSLNDSLLGQVVLKQRSRSNWSKTRSNLIIYMAISSLWMIMSKPYVEVLASLGRLEHVKGPLYSTLVPLYYVCTSCGLETPNLKKAVLTALELDLWPSILVKWEEKGKGPTLLNQYCPHSQPSINWLTKGYYNLVDRASEKPQMIHSSTTLCVHNIQKQ